MKSSELLPSYDNLRKTFVNDTIGRSADVIRFANMLNVIDSSFSIALDSSWGSGKTFFVKQVKMFLDANNDHVHAVPDPDKSLFQSKWSDFSRKPMPDFQPQVCVYYDAWANDGEEDPVLSLVYEIINDVESDYSLPKDGDCIKIAFSRGKAESEVGHGGNRVQLVWGETVSVPDSRSAQQGSGQLYYLGSSCTQHGDHHAGRGVCKDTGQNKPHSSL